MSFMEANPLIMTYRVQEAVSVLIQIYKVYVQVSTSTIGVKIETLSREYVFTFFTK